MKVDARFSVVYIYAISNFPSELISFEFRERYNLQFEASSATCTVSTTTFKCHFIAVSHSNLMRQLLPKLNKKLWTIYIA